VSCTGPVSERITPIGPPKNTADHGRPAHRRMPGPISGHPRPRLRWYALITKSRRKARPCFRPPRTRTGVQYSGPISKITPHVHKLGGIGPPKLGKLLHKFGAGCQKLLWPTSLSRPPSAARHSTRKSVEYADLAGTLPTVDSPSRLGHQTALRQWRPASFRRVGPQQLQAGPPLIPISMPPAANCSRPWRLSWFSDPVEQPTAPENISGAREPAAAGPLRLSVARAVYRRPRHGTRCRRRNGNIFPL
jgi:hypothetical protein